MLPKITLKWRPKKNTADVFVGFSCRFVSGVDLFSLPTCPGLKYIVAAVAVLISVFSRKSSL